MTLVFKGRKTEEETFSDFPESLTEKVLKVSCLCSRPQLVDGSPIEVTLAKPVDKDSYVRYTRGTGGRGGSLLQTDYAAYTLGQVGP